MVPEAERRLEATEDVRAPVRRAGTVQALGGMTLIAVLACAAVVAVMRLASGAEPPEQPVAGFEDVVPTELGGGIAPGEVPEAVASAVELPVVGARVLDELPDGVGGCGGMFGPADDTELEGVVVTPGMMLVSLVGPEPSGMGGGPPMPPPAPISTPTPTPAEDVPGPSPAPTEVEPGLGGMLLREVCTLTLSGGAWQSQGSSAGPVEDFAMGMSGQMSCCDEDGLATASTAVIAPAGATWALQERGVYWLAYPLQPDQPLQLSWRFREGGFGPSVSTTHVLWVDDDGGVLGEQFITP